MASEPCSHLYPTLTITITLILRQVWQNQSLLLCYDKNEASRCISGLHRIKSDNRVMPNAKHFLNQASLMWRFASFLIWKLNVFGKTSDLKMSPKVLVKIVMGNFTIFLMFHCVNDNKNPKKSTDWIQITTENIRESISTPTHLKSSHPISYQMANYFYNKWLKERWWRCDEELVMIMKLIFSTTAADLLT